MVELIDPDVSEPEQDWDGPPADGRDVLLMNVEAGKMVGELVRTTLGPMGMDKLLVDSGGMGIVTNNGATILKENIEHPAAEIVRDVAKTQEEEVGDGTTTTAVLAGTLLEESEWLLEHDIHPTSIIRGYRAASGRARDRLAELAIDVDAEDSELLRDVARTSMTGKGTEGADEMLADLLVDVARRIDDDEALDFDHVDVQKIEGGWVNQSYLMDALVLEKERVDPAMPYIVQDADLALVNSDVEISSTQGGSAVDIADADELQTVLDREEQAVHAIVEHLLEMGVDVLVCHQHIDERIQGALAQAGIYAVQHTGDDRLPLVARGTGADIVTDVHDLSPEDLGHAERVAEEDVDGDLKTVVEGGARGDALTLVLRGTTDNLLDELQRAMEDGLEAVRLVLEDGKVVPGGGAVEADLAIELRDYATTTGHRRQFAIEAFADALEAVPRTLSENAGIDPIDGVIDLRTRHDEGETTVGIDAYTGETADMVEAGVYEPYSVKRGAIERATEAAIFLLRIDGIIPTSMTNEEAEEIDRLQAQEGGRPGGPGMGGPGGPGGPGGAM